MLVSSSDPCYSAVMEIMKRAYLNDLNGLDKNFKNLIDLKDQTHGRNALMHLVALGHVEAVCRLLEAGASVDCPDARGNTALHIAAIMQPELSESRSSVMIRTLLDAGAQIDAVNCKGATPLHLAANGLNVSGTRCLFEAGADVNAGNVLSSWHKKKLTPLQCAEKALHRKSRSTVHGVTDVFKLPWLSRSNELAKSVSKFYRRYAKSIVKDIASLRVADGWLGQAHDNKIDHVILGAIPDCKGRQMAYFRSAIKRGIFNSQCGDLSDAQWGAVGYGVKMLITEAWKDPECPLRGELSEMHVRSCLRELPNLVHSILWRKIKVASHITGGSRSRTRPCIDFPPTLGVENAHHQESPSFG